MLGLNSKDSYIGTEENQEKGLIRGYIEDFKELVDRGETELAYHYLVRDVAIGVAYILSYPVEKSLHITKNTLRKLRKTTS